MLLNALKMGSFNIHQVVYDEVVEKSCVGLPNYLNCLVRLVRLHNEGLYCHAERSEASRNPARETLAAAQGDIWGKQQARPCCHAEPQRSISTRSARDPSLRLRVTLGEAAGAIGKGHLLLLFRTVVGNSVCRRRPPIHLWKMRPSSDPAR
jgi:hypothetical protein